MRLLAQSVALSLSVRRQGVTFSKPAATNVWAVLENPRCSKIFQIPLLNSGVVSDAKGDFVSKTALGHWFYWCLYASLALVFFSPQNSVCSSSCSFFPWSSWKNILLRFFLRRSLCFLNRSCSSFVSSYLEVTVFSVVRWFSAYNCGVNLSASSLVDIFTDPLPWSDTDPCDKWRRARPHFRASMPCLSAFVCPNPWRAIG